MYGITENDRKQIDLKIKHQREFLKNFSLDLGDKDINLLDSTYSANLNPKKYFAEINNRVNSMFDYAKDKGLKPVFVTLTAPSKYHKRYKDGKLIFDPNETAKVLSEIWAKFLRLKLFKRMKEDTGHNLVYFRVYEPHKSSVPHLHAMLFLPVNYILPVKRRFKRYFNDFGTNKKAMDFRYTWYKEAGGAVAYIMKYITKTFKDTNTDNVNDSVYWYIKHKVRRFLSSRTLMPLFVYRKIRHHYKELDYDFVKLSEQYKSGQITRLFEDTCISIVDFNPHTEELEDIILWQKVVYENPLPVDNNSRVKEKLSFKKKEKPIVVKHNGKEYVYNKDTQQFKQAPVVPSKLTDFQLWNYFKKELKNSDCEIATYLVAENEMKKRGFIKGEIQSLNVVDYGF